MAFYLKFSFKSVTKWEKVVEYVEVFYRFVTVVYIFQGSNGFFYKRI